MTLTTLPALIALLPAMIGPLPLEQGSRSLLLALCGGGTMTIALQGDGSVPPAPATTPCCAKGCHNPERRKLLDRGQ